MFHKCHRIKAWNDYVVDTKQTQSHPPSDLTNNKDNLQVNNYVDTNKK